MKKLAFLKKLMKKLILLTYLIKIDETILNRTTDGFKGMVTVRATLLIFFKKGVQELKRLINKYISKFNNTQEVKDNNIR